LHQENKFISNSINTNIKAKDDKGEETLIEKERIRSGISITLSRN
jgi:hypothetical protein